MLIGHGFDIHRLVEGKELVIGGVNIPYELGADAHSDGDVIYHSVVDAILGEEGGGRRRGEEEEKGGRGGVYSFVACLSHLTIDNAPLDTGGGGVVLIIIIMHGRSRMAIDPHIPTMPGRSMSGFHQPGIH